MKIILDEFSGIGGFSFAADKVWHDLTHVFIEYDPFCQAVLKKHWPQAEINGDIHAFIADTKNFRRIYGKHGIKSAKTRQQALGESVSDIHASALHSIHGRTGCSYSPGEVYILTGGFPCQPFSNAGRRRGTEDDRYLWPAMLESIALFRPKWVVAENVAGLITWNDGMVLETVCSDLEKEGYEVQPVVIPAVAVDAPHRRDRIWFIGRDTRSEPIRSSEGGGMAGNVFQEGKREKSGDSIGRSGGDALDSKSLGRKSRTGQQPDVGTKKHGRAKTTGGGPEPSQRSSSEQWKESWPDAAARLCAVDDGISGGLVRPRGWRNAALKAAGNAIVPQVAEQIFRIIKQVDTYGEK